MAASALSSEALPVAPEVVTMTAVSSTGQQPLPPNQPVLQQTVVYDADQLPEESPLEETNTVEQARPIGTKRAREPSVEEEAKVEQKRIRQDVFPQTTTAVTSNVEVIEIDDQDEPTVVDTVDVNDAEDEVSLIHLNFSFGRTQLGKWAAI